MSTYKILKYQKSPTRGQVEHYVNDSEGIIIEWDNEESVNLVVRLLQENSPDEYDYKVIKS
jgi:hypothetical protein